MKRLLLTPALIAGLLAVCASALMAAMPPSIGGQGTSGAVRKTAPIGAGTVTPSGAFQVTGLNPPVIMHIGVYSGPVPSTNTAYESWGMSMVSNMYRSGTPLAVVTMPAGGLSWDLDAHDLVQSADLSSNVLWFVIHVVSTSPSYKFYPSQLTFWEFSNDGNNDSLGKTNSMDDPTYAYSPWEVGINWSASGPRVSDQWITSGYWDQTPVNEFIAIGSISSYYLASYAAVSNYLWSFTDKVTGLNEVYIRGTWVFAQGTNSWHVSKTMHLQTKLDMAYASCSVNSDSNVVVGANADANDSFILQMSEGLQPPIWTDVSFLNGLDYYLDYRWDPQRYYRLVPQ